MRSPRKLRSARDLCHETQIKCFGGEPCKAARINLGIKCSSNASNQIARPNGTRNKAPYFRLFWSISSKPEIEQSPTRCGPAMGRRISGKSRLAWSLCKLFANRITRIQIYMLQISHLHSPLTQSHHLLNRHGKFFGPILISWRTRTALLDKLECYR